MCINGKMILNETISRMAGGGIEENDEVGYFKYDIL
jgi:hypothetical protein